MGVQIDVVSKKSIRFGMIIGASIPSNIRPAIRTGMYTITNFLKKHEAMFRNRISGAPDRMVGNMNDVITARPRFIHACIITVCDKEVQL